MNKPVIVSAAVLVALALVVGGFIIINQTEELSSSTTKKGNIILQEGSQDSSTEVNYQEGATLHDFSKPQDVTTLQVKDIVEGDGQVVEPGATVVAHYTGAYASDGTIFQSSHNGPNQPIPFSLNEVIAGWTQGVPGMKVGGTRRLIIPAELAYGPEPEGYVQGSTPRPMGALIFDIELVDIN